MLNQIDILSEKRVVRIGNLAEHLYLEGVQAVLFLLHCIKISVKHKNILFIG